MTAKIEGIRLPETDEWIGQHTDRLTPPFEWTRLTGGTSNLTFLIRDSKGRRAVVRTEPSRAALRMLHAAAQRHALDGQAPDRTLAQAA